MAINVIKRHFGVPIEANAILGDNQSFATISTLPHSMLSKKEIPCISQGNGSCGSLCMVARI